METDIYDVYHNEGAGCEVLTVNCWDAANWIGYYKFTYYGHTLPMNFLDGEGVDWNNWYYDGYIPLNYVIGVNGLVYYRNSGYYPTAISQAIERTIYPDNDPPTVYGQNPPDGSTDVDVDKQIKCHVEDAGFGVDEGSLSMTVTAEDRGEIEGDLNISGDILDFFLRFTPDEDLPYDTEITVAVDATDLDGNVMPTETWSFTTEQDPSTVVTPTSLGVIKAGYTE